jgi:hypothetical protein
MQQPQIIDKLVSFDEDHSDSAAGPTLVIKHEQEIPADWLSGLVKERIDSLHTPAGDFHRVASIPIAVLEQWDREGFRIEEHNIHEILARLRKHSFDKFITSNKV